MQYLEENKQLIMAILENQNLGKSAECASDNKRTEIYDHLLLSVSQSHHGLAVPIRYQNQLQQNLMYLAKIADAQPEAPKIPNQPEASPKVEPNSALINLQMPSHSSDQQEHYKHPSQTAMSQQEGFLASKFPLSLNDHHQLPDVQQQQFIPGQIGMRSGASTSTGRYQGPRSSFMNVQGSEQDNL
ncbi:hypothetical protein Pint_05480 [Pistacia integerrima]|uniref:Uncharacterized protein n=1 Tax=Pistacia integerrima TaxID=434235 RepID=A0ACC0Z6N7_9ROSI|nr:hypothetical protein Pint_05480 [Pistacia integerrima]